MKQSSLWNVKECVIEINSLHLMTCWPLLLVDKTSYIKKCQILHFMYTLLITQIQSPYWFIHVDFGSHQINKGSFLKGIMIKVIDPSDCLMAHPTHALNRCKKIPQIKISDVKSHSTPWLTHVDEQNASTPVSWWESCDNITTSH